MTINDDISKEFEEVTVDEDRARLSAELGVETDTIRVLRPRWNLLMREGVIMRLTIRRWRARTTLSLEDLGIHLSEEEQDDFGVLLDLGQKKLLPPRLFQRLQATDSSARKALERDSYKTYWGQFVPVTAFAKVRERMAEFEAGYMALRDEIVNHYDKHLNTLRANYWKAAYAAYDRLTTLNPDLLEEDKETFATNFVQRIIAKIPDAEAIKYSFAFELDMTYIPLPSLLAEQQAQAEKIEAKRRIEAEQEQAEVEQIREQTRTVRYEEEAKRREIEAETRAKETAAEAHARLMEEMHAEVIAKAQRKKEQMIDGFLTDVVDQLNSIIFDACADTLSAIKQKDKMTAGDVKRLKTMIERIGNLNFIGDKDANKMIEKVRQQLAISYRKRDMKELQGILRDITIVTRQQLLAVGATPRSTQELGIPNEVPPLITRQARANLKLDMEEVPQLDLRGPRKSDSDAEFEGVI